MGGIFGAEGDIDELERQLRATCVAQSLRREVKYGRISAENIAAYTALVDVFFRNLGQRDLHYRQLFLDRAFVHVPSPGADDLTALDVQFRIYYQFLKHAFGLRYLPRSEGTTHQIVLQLDGHSSQHHTDALRRFVQDLPAQLDRDDLALQVSYVRSGKFRLLQTCDLLLGAAGSYGNRHHKRRSGVGRGMSGKQKLRLQLAKTIYQSLREQNGVERGKGAFNWFETTGRDGRWENLLQHKVRVWKIVPRRYRLDKGWQNDHLTPDGLYQGPDLDDRIRLAARELPGQPDTD